MSFKIEPRNVRVKKIQKIGNTSMVRATITSFRKDSRQPEGEQYIPSVWYATFFGQAADFVLSLEEGTLIRLVEAYIAKEPYEKDGEQKWPNHPNVSVREAELAERQGKPKSAKPQPEPEPQIDEDEFPF